MTAEQLKNSILQMAVSGKLVPQDPNDEPASVLLERVRKEKEQLIKEGKIKKEKNPSYIFRGADNTPYEKVGINDPVSIADEVPFEIPESWEWARWGSIAQSIQYGYNAPALQSGRMKMVRISDIQDGKVRWSSVPYCDIPDSDIETYLLRKNDILFARTGGTVGKSYLVDDVPIEAIYAGYLIRTRYSDSLCPLYLKFFMESPLYWAQLKEGTTVTAQPNCNGKTLANMLLPIPPAGEQHRIAEILLKLQPLVQKYSDVEDILNNLNSKFPEQLKKSILQLAVQGKLVDQDPNDEPASVLLERISSEKERLIAEGKIKRDKNESVIFRRDNSHYEKLGSKERCIDAQIPFEVPDSWAWVRLGTIISLLSGQDFDPSGYNAFGRGIPYITGASNIEDGTVQINRWTENPKNIARSGELLIVCKGAGVGKMAILKEDAVHIARQIMAISPIYISIYYLQVCLEYNLEQLRKNMQGVIPGISRIDVLNILFPVPPLNEQERIVEQIKAILPMIKSLR